MTRVVSQDQARDELKAFLEEFPLLSRYHIGHILDMFPLGTQLENIAKYSLPSIVRLRCPVCKTTNPFRSITSYDKLLVGKPNAVYTRTFRCSGCEEQTANFFLEFDRDRRWVRKVGQLPEWDISLDRDLEEALGADAELFKRAKVCVGQSYGVGACTYLRRVLENQITPLLQLVRQNRADDGALEEELTRIDEILGGRVADERIRLAREVLPDSILVEGDNPLELIYDQLSVGLHRKDEQECTEIAKDLLGPLRHVVVSLSKEREQRRQRRGFGEQIRALRKRAQGRA